MKAAAWKFSSKEARALVERWCASLDPASAGGISTAEMREACKRLSLETTREFLSDSYIGWRPEGTYSMRLEQLHTALFERLGELDPDALRDFPAPEEWLQRWQPVTGFFKGVASKDGVRAFDLLREWSPDKNRDITTAVTGPLVEGWAHSDPSAAWTWLAWTRSGEPGWNQAATAYFAGVQNARWEDYPEKIKAIDRDSRIGSGAGSLLRQELAKRWIQEDPAAALEYYDKSSSEAKVKQTYFDPEQRGMDQDVIHLSQIAAPWLGSDPRCLAKLSEVLANTSSRFRDIDPDEVLAAIAFGSSHPVELRAKAKEQIRDLEGAERRQAERQVKSRVNLGVRYEFGP